MRGPSCCPFKRILNLMLLKLSILPFGFWIDIDNIFFDDMVNRIYPSEIQLYKADVSEIEA